MHTLLDHDLDDETLEEEQPPAECAWTKCDRPAVGEGYICRYHLDRRREAARRVAASLGRNSR